MAANQRPPITTLQSPDELINRIQKIIKDVLDFVYALPTSAGQNLFAGLALGTTAVGVQHGLGRPIQGWLIVRADSGATIYEASTSSDPNNVVNLIATAPINCSLIFF